MFTALHNVWRHSPFESAEFSCVMLVLILYVHLYTFQSCRDGFLSSWIEPALNIGFNILLKGIGFGESRTSSPSILSLTPYQLSYCAPQQKSVKTLSSFVGVLQDLTTTSAVFDMGGSRVWKGGRDTLPLENHNLLYVSLEKLAWTP